MSIVSEDKYKLMKKACTKKQNLLFDQIFNKNKPFPIKNTICKIWHKKTEYVRFRIADGNGLFYIEGAKVGSQTVAYANYEVLTPKSLNQFK